MRFDKIFAMISGELTKGRSALTAIGIEISRGVKYEVRFTGVNSQTPPPKIMRLYGMPLWTKMHGVFYHSPFRTAVTFWGQSSQNLSSLSPNRTAVLKGLRNRPFFSPEW